MYLDYILFAIGGTLLLISILLGVVLLEAVFISA